MELDLTAAIEAGAQELLAAWYDRDGKPTPITDRERAEVADQPDGWCLECAGVGVAALRAATLVVRAAAPLIEEAVRDEPVNLRHVGWMGQQGGFVTPDELLQSGLWAPAGDGSWWRRVYVMLTAEERAAIHAGGDDA